MTFGAFVDVLLWAFVWICLIGIIGLNLIAMFGDHFIERDA